MQPVPVQQLAITAQPPGGYEIQPLRPATPPRQPWRKRDDQLAVMEHPRARRRDQAVVRLAGECNDRAMADVVVVRSGS